MMKMLGAEVGAIGNRPRTSAVVAGLRRPSEACDRPPAAIPNPLLSL